MIHLIIIIVMVGIAFYLKNFSDDPLVQQAFAIMAAFSWIIFFAFRMLKGKKEVGEKPIKLDMETRKFYQDYDPLSELDDEGKLINSSKIEDNKNENKKED